MVKISELLTVKKFGFAVSKWNLSQSSMVVLQLLKSLPTHLKFKVFMNNFFTNSRLFKALKTLNIGACGTAKINSGYFLELVQIRAAAIKQKDWEKLGLMTIKSNEKKNVDGADILCMAWVDLNTVQYMITVYTPDEMKVSIWKDAKRRHGISKTAISHVDGVSKLPFSALIVEYNSHMGGSDGNAQQRAYYSPHSSDRRYWWPLFIFFFEAAVFNAFKLWKLLYSDSNLTHSEFQYQITEELFTGGATRLKVDSVVRKSTADSTSYEWKHRDKRAYCTSAGKRRPDSKNVNRCKKYQLIASKKSGYLKQYGNARDAGPVAASRGAGRHCITDFGIFAMWRNITLRD